MTQAGLNPEDNPLRDVLYSIGNQEAPEYIWHWFFRYFAGGKDNFKREPVDFLENYQALFLMGQKLLEQKFTTGEYSTIIRDLQTPGHTYYYIGDTHGSFDDTYQIIDYLIKVFQVYPHVKVVWIGDIVDRNPFDLQNLAFILAFWILFPNNVFIIRGNHEDSSVCSRYGFSQHLYEKAGSRDNFEPIWALITDFFSKLPLGFLNQCGEKRVLVLHGGIPFDVKNYAPVDLLQAEPRLNCFQKEHFDMDVYSQTILWADPDPQLSEMVAPTPRTGRPRFSQAAFDQFMQLNNVDLLIRGHQKFAEGYNLLWGNRLVTLFSTSTYDGRPIGRARFLRLKPSTAVADLGPEEDDRDGILLVDEGYLEGQLQYHYHGKTSQ